MQYNLQPHLPFPMHNWISVIKEGQIYSDFKYAYMFSLNVSEDYFIVTFPASSRITATTPKNGKQADPGFVGVHPGSGVITCPPVSVCKLVCWSNARMTELTSSLFSKDRNCDKMHLKEDLPANKCRLLNSFQIRHIYDTIAMLLGWLAHRLFPELSMWKDHTSVQILLRISLEPLLQLEQYKILTPKKPSVIWLDKFFTYF